MGAGLFAGSVDASPFCCDGAVNFRPITPNIGEPGQLGVSDLADNSAATSWQGCLGWLHTRDNDQKWLLDY